MRDRLWVSETASEALVHLRKLLNAGCESEGFCRYCGEHVDPEETHDPACVYRSARAFVDALKVTPPFPPFAMGGGSR